MSDEDFEQRVADLLERASAAASEHDIVSEEHATRTALEYAQQRRGTDGFRATEQRIRGLRSLGTLTPRQLVGVVKPEAISDYMARTGRILGRGVAAPIEVYEDRIIQGGKVKVIDGSTQAQVFLDGQMQITQRPTLTRMLLLSPLPGSALIPGFALQKKEKNDTRTGEFQVGGRDWSMTTPINPLLLTEPRSIAERINRTAEAIANGPSSTPQVGASEPTVSATPPDDVLSRLERIAALSAAGAITGAEAEALKREVLDPRGV